MNVVILIGNLGTKPELKTVKGTEICEFRLATKGYKGETTWHSIVCFGRQAETAAKYLDKGRKVGIQGRIKEERWADKDGNNRTTYKIIASNVEFLGAGNQADAPAAQIESEKEVPMASPGNEEIPF